MALNLDPRTQNETKRTKRCRSQRPRSVRQKEKHVKEKKKTSIVAVIKKNELGGMRGETNTDSKR